MSEMIEQVARAIEATMFAPHELPITGELHERYLETSRAAIAAMRKPTIKMAKVAFSFIGSNLRYEEVYTHMIDAALDNCNAQDKSFEFGSICRAICNAPARYFGYGKCLYISAQDNYLTVDDAIPPIGSEDVYPLPSDECLRAAKVAYRAGRGYSSSRA